MQLARFTQRTEVEHGATTEVARVAERLVHRARKHIQLVQADRRPIEFVVVLTLALS